jgi:hypothetical protein
MGLVAVSNPAQPMGRPTRRALWASMVSPGVGAGATRSWAAKGDEAAVQVAVTGWLSGSRSPTLRPSHCELELLILAEAWMGTLDTLTMRCRCAHKRICSRMHSGEEL